MGAGGAVGRAGGPGPSPQGTGGPNFRASQFGNLGSQPSFSPRPPTPDFTQPSPQQPGKGGSSGSPVESPLEQRARDTTTGLGNLNRTEQTGLGFAGGLGQLTGAEQQGLQTAGGLGQLRGTEQIGLGFAGGLGNLRNPERQALGTAGALSQGNLNAAEQAALGQIQRFSGGEIGQSPATQAALASLRPGIQNDLALAGLGNSAEVGSAISAASAPILAEEIRQRSGAIGELTGLGRTVRGSQQFGAGLQSQIGAASRAGDQAAAGFFTRAGEAQRAGDTASAQIFQRAGEAQRNGNAQAAQMFQRAGEAQRAGRIEEANQLNQQAQTLSQRESRLLGEAGEEEERQRAFAAQQQEANFQDFLRRQGIASNLTTGLLGGLPSITGSRTVSSSSGGGK